MKIALFLDSLKTGGAEHQFSRMATALVAEGMEVCFVTIFPGGQYWEELKQNSSIKLHSLFSVKGQTFSLRFFQYLSAAIRLRIWIDEESPLIIYSAMNCPNLIAAIALLCKQTKLFWGFRSSKEELKWRLALPLKLMRFFQWKPCAFIANSFEGKLYFEKIGFCQRNWHVIHNGIDNEKFMFSVESRKDWRKRLNIADNTFIIGHVGRITGKKDHQTLLNAARLFCDHSEDFRVVCAGSGDPTLLKKLLDLSILLGIEEKIVWLGEVSDVKSLYSAFDVFTLSSSEGEGFPNVIGEAMSCGLSCVVTDTGDSRMIVGDQGIVVPPCNPAKLCQGWICIQNKSFPYLKSIEKRTAMNTTFSISIMVDSTMRTLLKYI